MTLSRFMIEATRAHPGISFNFFRQEHILYFSTDRADLESLMMSIQISCKTIAELISRAGTVDLTGNSVLSMTTANSTSLYESGSCSIDFCDLPQMM